LNAFDDRTEAWNVTSGLSNLNATDGKLTWDDDAQGGIVVDHGNNTDWGGNDANFQPGVGQVDLTGLSSIQFINVVYTGDDPTINVEFFLQVTSSWAWKGSSALIGNDITFEAGVPQSVTVPLESLLPDEIVSIKTWGMQIRSHTSPASWSLEEVRSAGTPLTERMIAWYSPDAPDNGYQSTFIHFDHKAIKNSDQATNSTIGLTINPAAGVGGALEFTSLGGVLNDQQAGIGGSLCLGTGYGNVSTSNNDWDSRPIDLSNYQSIEWLMKAEGEPGAQVSVQLYLQLGLPTYSSWTWKDMVGSPQVLTADGQWYKITGETTGIDSEYVYRIGFNLWGHPTDLKISLDHVRGHNEPQTVIENWGLY
jgi:hypothetical protein